MENVTASTPLTPATIQGIGVYSFNIGDFSAMVISDGSDAFPAWPVWAQNAPQEEFEALLHAHFLPTDALDVHINSLFVNTGQEKVLIDPGAGSSFGPRFGNVLRNLQRAGVDPSEITVVVISHGHNDHFHSLLTTDGALTFPKARIIWAEDEWAYWCSAQAERDVNALPLPDNTKAGIIHSVRLVLPATEHQTERLLAGSEVVPGITLVPAPGHTRANTAVLVSSGDEQLLYAGDVIHHFVTSLARPDWSAVFDHLPEVARVTRRRLLDRAASERMLVMAYHIPFPALGHVRRQNGAFDWEPLTWHW